MPCALSFWVWFPISTYTCPVLVFLLRRINISLCRKRLHDILCSCFSMCFREAWNRFDVCARSLSDVLANVPQADHIWSCVYFLGFICSLKGSTYMVCIWSLFPHLKSPASNFLFQNVNSRQPCSVSVKSDVLYLFFSSQVHHLSFPRNYHPHPMSVYNKTISPPLKLWTSPELLPYSGLY